MLSGVGLCDELIARHRGVLLTVMRLLSDVGLCDELIARHRGVLLTVMRRSV